MQHLGVPKCAEGYRRGATQSYSLGAVLYSCPHLGCGPHSITDQCGTMPLHPSWHVATQSNPFGVAPCNCPYHSCGPRINTVQCSTMASLIGTTTLCILRRGQYCIQRLAIALIIAVSIRYQMPNSMNHVDEPCCKFATRCHYTILRRCLRAFLCMTSSHSKVTSVSVGRACSGTDVLNVPPWRRHGSYACMPYGCHMAANCIMETMV